MGNIATNYMQLIMSRLVSSLMLLSLMVMLVADHGEAMDAPMAHKSKRDDAGCVENCISNDEMSEEACKSKCDEDDDDGDDDDNDADDDDDDGDDDDDDDDDDDGFWMWGSEECVMWDHTRNVCFSRGKDLRDLL